MSDVLRGLQMRQPGLTHERGAARGALPLFPRCARALLTAAVAVSTVAAAGLSAGRLRKVDSVVLKGAPRADQVVAFSGGFVVREADFRRPGTQQIAVYDANGNLESRVGRYGPGPFEFDRLVGIALGPDRAIWAVDLYSKVIRYSLQGRPLSTTLIQNPGFEPQAIALVPRRRVFYLAGCQPLHYYLDLGCSLLHEYSIAGRAFQRSFLPTAPVAVRDHLFPLENYFLAAGQNGDLFFADGPVFELDRLNPRTGSIRRFPIRSSRAQPPGPLLTGQQAAYYERRYREACLIQALFAAGRVVLVQLRVPAEHEGCLEAFLGSGRQIATDLLSPGRLVGTDEENFLFAQQGPQGVRLTEWRFTGQ